MSDHNHGPDERCPICEGQGTREERYQAYAERAMDLITEHGWMVQGVGSGETTPTYAYSIGMQRLSQRMPVVITSDATDDVEVGTLIQDVPEIIVIGLPMQIATGLINNVGNLILDGQQFGDWSSSDDVIAKLPVVFRVIDVKAVDEHCGWLRTLFPDTHHMLHMIYPDKQRRFPWDEGCEVMGQYDLKLTYQTGVLAKGELQ